MTLLLLLHGFTGGPSSYDRVLEALDALDAGGAPPRVIAPALTGHGVPASALEVARFEDEVARLSGLIPEGERAVVVGYSLGARLALGVLLRYPERVRSLVGISGSAGLRTEVERAERRSRDHALAESLERDGLAAFIAHWEAQPLFATQRSLPSELRAEERARRFAHTPDGLAHSLRTTGLAEMPDYTRLLGKAEAPAELLAGELDPRFCATGRAIAEALPRARFTCVPGAGHNLLLENPQAVAQAIQRGLAG